MLKTLYSKDELLDKTIHKYGFESDLTLAVASLLYDSNFTLYDLNFLIECLLSQNLSFC